MLVRTVHVPDTYILPTDNEAYSELAIGLLQRMLDDPCIILLDSGGMEGTLAAAIRERLQEASPPRRAQAQQILMELKKRGRLIPTVVNGAKARRTVSDTAVAVANREQADIVFTPPQWADAALKRPTVCPLTFTSSPAAQMLRDAHCFSTRVANGNQAMGPEDFGRKVWQPLFTHATHVRVYDRYIGQALQMKEKDSVTQQRYEDAAPDFASTLQWMAEQFATHARHGGQKQLVINTRLKEDLVNGSRTAGLRRQRELLREFADSLGQANKHLDVAMNVGLATTIRDMAHGRYLFTNQAQVMFDPGFDFLDRHGSFKKPVEVVSYKLDAGLIKSAHHPLMQLLTSCLGE